MLNEHVQMAKANNPVNGLRMTLKARAKINLTLDIIGKRADGYHEIDTIFQQVELCDILSVERMPGELTVSCSTEQLSGENNIALQAAKALRQRYKVREGAKISIQKCIPLQAGLGGGSSDAAVALLGLRKIWQLGISDQELAKLSSEIGMDVAYHLIGDTCRGKGRGEMISRIPDFPAHYVIIIVPSFGISTKEAYASLDLSLCGKSKSTESFARSYDLSLMHNDFEYSLFKAYPILAQIKKDLMPHTLLSGSGSCVFGLFREKEEAEKRFRKIRQKYPHSYLTTTAIKAADNDGF